VNATSLVKKFVKQDLVLLVTCRSLTSQLATCHTSHFVKQLPGLFDTQTTNKTNINESKSVFVKITAQEKSETVMLSVLAEGRTLDTTCYSEQKEPSVRKTC
jgi:hypothetical protein